MKIYPENNREARIVLLFCELVQFADGVVPVEYPAVNTSASAASIASGNSSQAIPAKKVKCVAWDLDNTVWDGTFVESDPELLAVRPGVFETMKALDERGIIQIVVSKNTEDEVRSTLDRLGISDWFVALFVNWKPKSENLKAAAELLNINIDSFALIDDSSFEREEVAFSLPMVRVYDESVVSCGGKGQTVADGMIGAPILALPEFDVPTTAEGKRRRHMYKTEMVRKEASSQSGGDQLDFLRSCKLRARLFTPNDDASISRSYELLQRTNQLNLSGNRYDKESFFAKMREDRATHLAMTCADRFGDYGQVLYLEASVNSDDSSLLVIDEFALSCRVARKCVEAALAMRLLELFEPEGVKAIELRGKRTDRNGLLIDSFCAAGFRNESDEDTLLLRLSSADELVSPDVVQVTGGE
ncbi:HAD-IIIC family phosphatase [Bifidobacterium panos]|nr:HAD-IIIC family phosphatase [Bifidobacterium sp. DSM 109963]